MALPTSTISRAASTHGRTSSIQQSRNIKGISFQDARELIRAGDVVPSRKQFTSSPEHENTEFVCSCRLTQLRSHCSVKVGHDKYVAARITRDFLCVIPRLKPFRLFTHTMPDECSRNPASDIHVSSGKINDGDHSVIRIA